MKNKNRLSLFILSVIFMMGICCQTMAGGALWLGTKSLPAKFYTEIVKGNVPGHSIVHKFGHGDVGTTLVPITASLKYETPIAAIALEFVSSDVDDTSVGAGAREITIIGIDANYDEVTQVIATNGTTAVAIPINLRRLYRWYVSASGVYATTAIGSHQGTLTIRVASAGATWSTILFTPYPAGASEICAYTVPDGFRAYIISQEIDVDSSKSVDVLVFKRQGIDIVVAPFTQMTTMSHYVGVKGHRPSTPVTPINSFPARTDFGYMGKVSSGTADIVVHFEILLIADGY
jgi:hypothetical protein